MTYRIIMPQTRYEGVEWEVWAEKKSGMFTKDCFPHEDQAKTHAQALAEDSKVLWVSLTKVTREREFLKGKEIE